MRFENSKKNNFEGRWPYKAVLSYRQYIPDAGIEILSHRGREAAEVIDMCLSYKAEGAWVRQGAVYYFEDLNDIFYVRLYHGQHLELVSKAVGNLPD